MHYRTEPMYHDDWFVIPPEAYTLDDPAHIGSPMLAHDCLYNHFQTEKYSGACRFCFALRSCLNCCLAEWWTAPGLPSEPLGSNEVLYVNKDSGTLIWDDRGHISFSSSSS